MTYLERITYLTGNFLQLSQFVLKNAFRFSLLNEAKNKTNSYLKGSEVADASLLRLDDLIKENINKSGQDLALYFQDKGFSTKDYSNLKRILLKRDYIVSYYYIDNAYDLSKEDVNIYNSRISELEGYCNDAIAINKNLIKDFDKLYDTFLY